MPRLISKPYGRDSYSVSFDSYFMSSHQYKFSHDATLLVSSLFLYIYNFISQTGAQVSLDTGFRFPRVYL